MTTFHATMRAIYYLIWLTGAILILVLFMNDKIGFWGIILTFIVVSTVAGIVDPDKNDEDDEEEKEKQTKKQEQEERRRSHEEIRESIRRATEQLNERLRQSRATFESDDDDDDDETIKISHETVKSLRNLLMLHHNSHGTDKDYMASKMAADTSRYMQLFNDELNKSKRRVSNS